MEQTVEAPRPYRWSRAQYRRIREMGWFEGEEVELTDGEIVVVRPRRGARFGPNGPAARRWTREEFWRMFDLGWFEGRRVELIDGEIIEVPAQKNLHAIAIKLAEDALSAAFGPRYWVRVQMTLDLGPYFVPDPDLAVVRGRPRDHVTRGNPTSALLVVEVSESTLGSDRRRKGGLYAAAGIADYWIVNLVQHQLEVYRRPTADAAEPLGYKYASRKILDPGDAVAPLAARKARVAVDDLLP
jgi:Uma2 family endonuclease